MTNKEAFFETKLDEVDVEVPGRGTVTVRALTRGEVLELRGVEVPHAHMERKLLSAALVSPKMTEKDVGRWQAASAAGEIEPVTNAIMNLSGLKAEATKEEVKNFRE